MAKALKVACIGEAMIEIAAPQLPGSAQLSVAGDTFNTAVYLRRALPLEHDVYFVSCLGQDQLSDHMIGFMRSEGVEADHIYRSADHLPGIYSITTDTEGERSFQYWRDNSAARQLFQPGVGPDFDALEEFDLIYTSAIGMAILPPDVRNGFLDWIETYRNKGGKFAFDSNYRPTLWPDKGVAQQFVDRAWQICDIALPSIDDEMDLFEQTEGEVQARFAHYPDCKGALKRGALGPVAINADVAEGLSFPKAHFVVDTTAAGDSFSGGFLGAYLTGKSVGEAMMKGHEFACEVIAHRGAIIPRATHAHSGN